jgi:hypothetical protein
MAAGRIAEFFFEKRPHGFNHLRIMRSCGVIVKVNGLGHAYDLLGRKYFDKK